MRYQLWLLEGVDRFNDNRCARYQSCCLRYEASVWDTLFDQTDKGSFVLTINARALSYCRGSGEGYAMVLYSLHAVRTYALLTPLATIE